MTLGSEEPGKRAKKRGIIIHGVNHRLADSLIHEHTLMESSLYEQPISPFVAFSIWLYIVICVTLVFAVWTLPRVATGFRLKSM